MGGSKVKHFLVPFSLRRAGVNFFLSAVIHRWACQDVSLELNKGISFVCVCVVFLFCLMLFT